MLRAKIVLEEYPFLQPIVYGLTTMSASEQEWVEAAEDIKTGPLTDDPETLKKLLERDPDFINKYRFIMTAAIIDNPTIPEQLKYDLLEISFGTMIVG